MYSVQSNNKTDSPVPASQIKRFSVCPIFLPPANLFFPQAHSLSMV